MIFCKIFLRPEHGLIIITSVLLGKKSIIKFSSLVIVYEQQCFSNILK